MTDLLGWLLVTIKCTRLSLNLIFSVEVYMQAVFSALTCG